MKLSFWGAAKQVTGSMFLLELEDDYRILIDCGMDMDEKNQADEKRKHKIGIFPFEPSMIQAVILTHAHIDHSGYIPNLFREGFEGKIYCTAPTLELSSLLLADSAGLNQRKLKRTQKIKNIEKRKEELKNMQDLYLQKQVDESLRRFVTVPFKHHKKIKQGLKVTFIPTGHLLGAANVLLEIEENGKTKKICFSGDIGRQNYPLLVEPEAVPEVDYLVCETTYGQREHQDKEDAEDLVYDIIQKACVENPIGKLIVPAFSVGRTQAMLYTLNKLSVEGKLPDLKVFADSPLALRSTQVYQKYVSFLNREAQDFYAEHQSLFNFENLIYVEDVKRSRYISDYPEACIIISSSGMIQGGRIEKHVKKNLENKNATIFMIGYAAEGTLGYELRQGNKTLETKNKTIDIAANIVSMDRFSGHGDIHDLLRFVRWQKPEKLKKVFLVHGDEEAMQNLQNVLQKEGYQDVEMPSYGQSFEL